MGGESGGDQARFVVQRVSDPFGSRLQDLVHGAKVEMRIVVCAIYRWRNDSCSVNQESPSERGAG